MPKSKRNKVVPISKVKKQDNLSFKKKDLSDKIKKYLNQYEFCYVINYKNMTTMPMQELRNYWSSSKFVIGKNKVMQVVLGKTDEEEFKTNTHKLSKFLKGNCGLFFSNEDPDLVVEYLLYLIFSYFKNYTCPYYGNVGTIPDKTEIIKSGLPQELASFPSSMESQFRQLGLQIKLDGGKFYLLSDYVVCKEGSPLTPEQTKMIVLYF
jgi:mRNA turnover protein 4